MFTNFTFTFKIKKKETEMEFLIKLNDKLYSLPIHTVIVILWAWALQTFHNPLMFWFKLGLLCWMILMIINFIQEKGNLKKVWKLFRSNGILPFLVGLNICVLTGPLSLVLAYLLRRGPKE